MSAGGWGCPHEVNGRCSKVRDLPCDPGMKGCELYGRYAFFDGSKNERLEHKRARAKAADPQRALATPDARSQRGDKESE